MLKNFLKDTAIYAIGVFALRLINFILMPFLTRKLLPAEYGAVTLILTLSPIVLYVITLQITQAIPRYCANNIDTLLKTAYVSTGFWFVVLVYSIFYGIMSCLPALGMLLVGIPCQPLLLHLLYGNICLFGIFTYLETQLRWDQKSVEYTIVSVVIMLFSAALIIPLVYLNMGITGYFIGYGLAQFFGCLLAYYFGRSNYQFILSKKLLKEMLGFSLPLAISAVGSYAFANMNQWLIRFFCGLNAVGIYGVASRFSSIISVVLGCVSLSITPMIYARYQEKEMPHFISFLFRMCLLGSLWAAAIFVLFNQPILSIVVGEKFWHAGPYIPLILLSYAFSSFYIFTPGQWLFHKTKEMAAVNLIAGAINVTLALIFIKILRIQGAVIALFLANLIQLGLNMYFSNRYYQIDFKISKVVFSLMLFIAFYLAHATLFLLLFFMFATLLLLLNKEDFSIYFMPKPLLEKASHS